MGQNCFQATHMSVIFLCQTSSGAVSLDLRFTLSHARAELNVATVESSRHTACWIGKGGTPERSAGRDGQMSEHMVACLVVHLSLEAVPLLERSRGLSRRAGTDLVEEALEVWEVTPSVVP